MTSKEYEDMLKNLEPKERIKVIRQGLGSYYKKRIETITSRKHELKSLANKKNNVKKQKKDIDDNHPLSSFLKRAKAKNEQIAKNAYKTKGDIFYLKDLTVEQRVKLNKLASKKDPVYLQLLREKISTNLSASAMQRKKEFYKKNIVKKDKKNS
ncbi:hypothetical protein NPX79_01475 [Spiroplasma endosymbiont of Anurida maritima]|uniref:hypothetical protein n=1 Tax=Spiroplasma endosymbiont of Anurida maritima TaxID=2967972 RepID=UPI0036D269B5